MLHTTITDYEWQQNVIHGKAHNKYGNFHQDWDFLLNRRTKMSATEMSTTIDKQTNRNRQTETSNDHGDTGHTYM